MLPNDGRPDYAVDEATGCWLWLKCIARGYGRKSAGNGQTRSAHVLYWEHEHGPTPEGMELHHTCGTKHCVNPAHLEPLTRREHMASDGRLEEFRQTRPGPRPQKLTPDDIHAIRELDGTHTQIGRRFGISGVMVGRIKRRTAWTTVPERDVEEFNEVQPEAA